MVTKEKTMKLSSLPEVLCIHVGRPPICKECASYTIKIFGVMYNSLL